MTELDSKFIEDLKSGSEFAYKRLFDEFYPRLCVFAKKYTNDLDAARDIVQDLFVKLYTGRDSIRFNKSIKSYLYQSVKNLSLNYLKHLQIDASHMSKIQSGFVEDSRSWQEKILETELEEQIFQCISQLPEQCQRIFRMNRIEGRKNKEIADQLGISIRTVETQISKALQRLRSDLQDYLAVLILILLGLWR